MPFKSLLGELNRIILTGNVNDVTFTLATQVAATDKINIFGSLNTFLVGLKLTDITLTELSNQAVVTIKDNTASAGLKVKNSDGSIELVNGTSGVNSFNALLHLHSAGSNARRGAIISSIPDTEDSGTTPVLAINLRQEDVTPITTRDLIHIENDGTKLWAFDKDGNINHQGNNLIDIGLLNYNLNTQTIVTGVITVTTGMTSVSSEGGAGTDDLDTINTPDFGRVLYVRDNSAVEDITYKDATGNLEMAGDFTQTNNVDMINFIGQNISTWLEVSRSDNG